MKLTYILYVTGGCFEKGESRSVGIDLVSITNTKLKWIERFLQYMDSYDVQVKYTSTDATEVFK